MKIVAQVGIPVWLLVLTCLVTLAYAGLFAARGRRRRLVVLGALTLATAFSTVATICMGFASAGRSGAALLLREGGAKAVSSMVQGLAESFAVGVMGFGTVTLIALLAAVGIHRGLHEGEQP